jgi:hypothetical protein
LVVLGEMMVGLGMEWVMFVWKVDVRKSFRGMYSSEDWREVVWREDMGCCCTWTVGWSRRRAF